MYDGWKIGVIAGSAGGLSVVLWSLFLAVLYSLGFLGSSKPRSANMPLDDDVPATDTVSVKEPQAKGPTAAELALERENEERAAWERAQRQAEQQIAARKAKEEEAAKEQQRQEAAAEAERARKAEEDAERQRAFAAARELHSRPASQRLSEVITTSQAAAVAAEIEQTKQARKTEVFGFGDLDPAADANAAAEASSSEQHKPTLSSSAPAPAPAQPQQQPPPPPPPAAQSSAAAAAPRLSVSAASSKIAAPSKPADGLNTIQRTRKASQDVELAAMKQAAQGNIKKFEVAETDAEAKRREAMQAALAASRAQREAKAAKEHALLHTEILEEKQKHLDEAAKLAALAGEMTDTPEIKTLRAEIGKLKELISKLKADEKRLEAEIVALKEQQAQAEARLSACQESDAALQSSIQREEEIALANDDALLAGISTSNSQFDQKKAENEAKLKKMMEEKKERAAAKLKLKAVEDRAKRIQGMLKGKIIDDKEYHPTSEEARSVDLTKEKWLQPNWTRVEAEEFLKSAPKGAFIIRVSNADHVLALQCGPLVDNRIGHMRLAGFEHDGKTWINVAGTMHFFEHMYDLVLFCHFRPFSFPKMHETNQITLSLEAVMEAEIKANELLEASQREIMAKMAAEEQAELERLKKEMSMKRKAANAKDRQKVEDAKKKRQDDYAARRAASQKAIQGEQDSLALAIKSQQAKAAELSDVTKRRVQAELDLDGKNKRLDQLLGELEQSKADALERARQLKNKADGIKPPAAVTLTADRLEINETIIFGSNNAVIDKESFELLNLVASTLQSNPQIIMLEVAGHTNGGGRNPEGMRLYRQKLSLDRAHSVVKYLVKEGVDQKRLFHTGFGDEKPLASNDTEEGRAVNRRVEFLVHH